ncbi:MAG: thioredoxin family protein, partial [Chloroflexi bacterium]|nr:thioredoxin family protein [Chloroflexota bacterium]
MTRNRDRVEANEKAVAIDPRDVAYFKTLEPLKVMVLVEDWCGDVIANLPVLGVLAREVGTLDVRCFLKDKNMDLMERYLNHG